MALHQLLALGKTIVVVVIGAAVVIASFYLGYLILVCCVILIIGIPVYWWNARSRRTNWYKDID